MQRPLPLIAALASCLLATGAFADNASVDNALRSQPDLSDFYKAFVSSGVSRQLSPDRVYTVFAPTNAAFAHYRPEEYPCLYNPQCAAQLAAVVRNHIVPGDIAINQTVLHQGGLYSVDGSFVTIGEDFRNSYSIDGKSIMYGTAMGGGMLYKIDGVIATPQEWVSLSAAQYAAQPAQRRTTVSRQVIHDPACGPAGCPDSSTESVTITRPVVDPASLAPAEGE